MMELQKERLERIWERVFGAITVDNVLELEKGKRFQLKVYN